MLLRLGVGLLWLIHLLPNSVIGALGRALGRLAYRLTSTTTADANLALCFPQLNNEERRDMARRHYASLGRSILELGILWWGSANRIRQFIRMEGEEHLLAAKDHRAVIAFAPHFVGVDMGSVRLTMEFEGAAIYSRQKDPYLDHLIMRGRKRFGQTRMIPRQDGLRGAVRALKQRLPLYVLPDMDFGDSTTVFADFFSVPAATVPILSRLARLGDAVVIPMVTRQTADGYVLTIYPPWRDFPTEDLQADARRMNAFIEERVLEMPEQYFWIHKRFRTRPPGDTRNFYR